MAVECEAKCPLIKSLKAGQIVGGGASGLTPGIGFMSSYRMNKNLDEACARAKDCSGPITQSELHTKDLLDKVLDLFRPTSFQKNPPTSDMFMRQTYRCGLMNNDPQA